MKLCTTIKCCGGNVCIFLNVFFSFVHRCINSVECMFCAKFELFGELSSRTNLHVVVDGADELKPFVVYHCHAPINLLSTLVSYCFALVLCQKIINAFYFLLFGVFSFLYFVAKLLSFHAINIHFSGESNVVRAQFCNVENYKFKIGYRQSVAKYENCPIFAYWENLAKIAVETVSEFKLREFAVESHYVKRVNWEMALFVGLAHSLHTFKQTPFCETQKFSFKDSRAACSNSLQICHSSSFSRSVFLFRQFYCLLNIDKRLHTKWNVWISMR